jgi:hypothetical protein
MTSSQEQLIVRIILFLVGRFLDKTKYRLFTPEQLEVVINNYLSELPKLGIRLSMADPSDVGVVNDEISTTVEALSSGADQHVVLSTSGRLPGVDP